MTPTDGPLVAAVTFAAGSIGLAAITVAWSSTRAAAGTLTSRRTNQLRAEMAAMAADYDRRLADLHTQLIETRRRHAALVDDGHTLLMR